MSVSPVNPATPQFSTPGASAAAETSEFGRTAVELAKESHKVNADLASIQKAMRDLSSYETELKSAEGKLLGMIQKGEVTEFAFSALDRKVFELSALVQGLRAAVGDAQFEVERNAVSASSQSTSSTSATSTSSTSSTSSTTTTAPSDEGKTAFELAKETHKVNADENSIAGALSKIGIFEASINRDKLKLAEILLNMETGVAETRSPAVFDQRIFDNEASVKALKANIEEARKEMERKATPAPAGGSTEAAGGTVKRPDEQQQFEAVIAELRLTKANFKVEPEPSSTQAAGRDVNLQEVAVLANKAKVAEWIQAGRTNEPAFVTLNELVYERESFIRDATKAILDAERRWADTPQGSAEFMSAAVGKQDTPETAAIRRDLEKLRVAAASKYTELQARNLEYSTVRDRSATQAEIDKADVASIAAQYAYDEARGAVERAETDLLLFNS